jgi:hypothetical protein
MKVKTMNWFQKMFSSDKKKGSGKTNSKNCAPILGIKEFVRDSIVGIASAIQEAQEKYSEENSAFAPLICPAWLPEGSMRGHSDKIYEIEFDLAVTLTESSSSNAEGKISLAVTGLYEGKLGCSTESGGSHELINRIRFKIPIRYPLAAVKHPADYSVSNTISKN